MKRLLLILFVSFAFIGCVSTPKVKYIDDVYYPERGYFEVWGAGIGDMKGSIGIDFRTINGTDKVIAIAEYSSKNIMTVSKYHKVLLKFSDGKEIKLSYNSRVPQYDGGNYFDLRATSGVIDDFGTLEIIRYNTDDGYKNREVWEEWAEGLIIRFNLIKAEVTAMYGDKE